VVLVTRKTQLELLRELRGTLDQVRFYLRSRGQEIAEYQAAHDRFAAAYAEVEQAIPADQRRVRVDRQDLDRFLFAPDDLVLVVGQDGLVANAAKYLQGQQVIGINADPERFDGVLCRHPPSAAGRLLAWTAAPRGGAFLVERRTMTVAEREDGQRLLALNEIFVGHRTHQSARYVLEASGRRERQSSSGLLCATGTGATGWARSISEQRRIERLLAGPDLLEPGERLLAHSEMAEGGVAFADGIESDALEFLGGQSLALRRAEEVLHLVVPAWES
jgi:NAD kinase